MLIKYFKKFLIFLIIIIYIYRIASKKLNFVQKKDLNNDININNITYKNKLKKEKFLIFKNLKRLKTFKRERLSHTYF